MQSVLGVSLFSTNISIFDGYVDTLLVNGFNYLRIDIPDYKNTSWLVQLKTSILRAIAKGANVIWDISSNTFN
jgi:hypothetical protein